MVPYDLPLHAGMMANLLITIVGEPIHGGGRYPPTTPPSCSPHLPTDVSFRSALGDDSDQGDMAIGHKNAYHDIT